MMHTFGELVNSLQDQRPKVPLAYLTQRDVARDDTLLAAIGWCVYTDEFLRRCTERVARAAHRDFCARHRADQAQRNLWRKEHGLDRDPATAITIDTRGFADDPSEARRTPRPGYVNVYHQDGTPKRIARLDFDNKGIEAVGPLPIAERAAPRHALAFPKSEAVPLPDAEYEDFAPIEADFQVPLALPEDRAVNYRELKGKAFVMQDERVGDYDPGAGCPGCGLTPALCHCPVWAEPEEDAYDGFQDDGADRYIALQGALVEAEHALADARHAQVALPEAIAALEAKRYKPGTPDEIARLAAIETYARAIARASTTEWQQAQRIVELADQLLAMELREEVAA